MSPATNTTSSCLKVGVIRYYPFLEVVTNSHHRSVQGSIIEVMDIITAKLNLCYEWIIPESATPGFRLPNGTWLGALGPLSRGEYDLVGVPFVPNSMLTQYVDFGVPMYMDWQGLVYRRPGLEGDLAGFVKPFSNTIWLMCLLSMIAAVLALFVLKWADSRIVSPPRRESARSLSGGRGKEEEEEDASGHLLASLSFTWYWVLSVALGQPSAWLFQRNSTRIMTGLWLLLSFVLGTVYRANLNAMIVVVKTYLPLKRVEDMLKTNVPLMLIKGSILHQLMSAAPPGSVLYKLKQRVILDLNPAQSVRDISAGKYATIVGITNMIYVFHNIYSKTATCPMYVAPEAFLTALPLSFAYPKDSPLKIRFNTIITNLKESGILDYTVKKAVRNGTICLQPMSFTTPNNNLTPLHLNDFYGVFAVYSAGLLLASVLLVLEVLLKRWTAASPRVLLVSGVSK
ncbi:glutamate [NMDA] receptor subunit 1 [Procambarus clarkii]|uniref:glutamate [NMDA] receptor subunit 1 n=1 Tax=Procambarus clarkii TaxID=6728 RepID=UPI001E676127|nr:glutamate [NMDA] receptor subunit 1-like [Procambarus clarkii]